MRTGRRREILPIVLGLAILVGALATGRAAGGDPVVRTMTLGPRITGVAVDEATGQDFVGVSDDAATGGRVDVLDTATGALLRAVPLPGSPDDIAVDGRAGRVFVSEQAGGSAGVAMLDARGGRVVRVLPAGAYGMTLTVDERAGRLYVASPAVDLCPRYTSVWPCSRVGVFDAASGRPLRAFVVHGRAVAMAVDARAGRLIVVGDDGSSHGTVSTLDAASGRLVRAVDLNAGLGFAPGYTLAVDDVTGRAFVLGAAYPTSATGAVYVFDTRDGALVRGQATATIPTAVAVDGGAGRAFVATLGAVRSAGNGGSIVPAGNGGVAILDARTGGVVRTVAAGGAALGVAVDPRAGRVLVANVGALDPGGSGTFEGPGSVTVLDGRTGGMVRAVTVGVYPVALAIDARRGRALVVNGGGTVRVPDPLGWAPPWLRRALPFVPRAPAPTRDVPASVTVLDVAR